jgi:hypothetical protein
MALSLQTQSVLIQSALNGVYFSNSSGFGLGDLIAEIVGEIMTNSTTLADSVTLAGRTFTNVTGLVILPSGQVGGLGANAALFSDPRTSTGTPYSVPAGKKLRVLGGKTSGGFMFGYADSSTGVGPQITQITTIADVSNSLTNKYIFINMPSTSPYAGGYYFWFNVSGSGTDPGPFGSRVGFEVDFATNSTPMAVADALQSTINASIPFAVNDAIASPTPLGVFVVANLFSGTITANSDNGSGTGFTFSIIGLGGAPAVDQLDPATLINPVYAGKTPGEVAAFNVLPFVELNTEYDTLITSSDIPAGKVPFIQGGLTSSFQMTLYALEIPA